MGAVFGLMLNLVILFFVIKIIEGLLNPIGALYFKREFKLLKWLFIITFSALAFSKLTYWTGIGMNSFVMSENGGKMPVDPSVAPPKIRKYFTDYKNDPRHRPYDPSKTKYYFLIDRFYGFNEGLPCIYSIGDTLIIKSVDIEFFVIYWFVWPAIVIVIWILIKDIWLVAKILRRKE